MAGGGNLGGGVSNSLPRKMLRLMSIFILSGVKAANAHPRSASMMGLLLIITVYVLLAAPRTGIVISSGNGLLSSGHTTFLPPPTTYLSRYVNRIPHTSSTPDNVKSGSLSRLFSVEEEEEMNGNIKKLTKSEKKKLVLVANAKKAVPFEVLLPTEEELEMMHEKERGGTNEDGPTVGLMEKIEEKAWEHALDLAFTSACRILSRRRFTEFIASPSNRLRMYSEARTDEHQHDVAALVMKSMGDWGRFGIQPLRLVSEYETEDSKSIVYNTLKGGEFDGELRFSVKRQNGERDSTHDDHRVVVSVTLLIPKNGRKIKDKIASKMLSLLAESIATSSITEAKQIISRELQCSIYRGRAKSRAAEKRHIAFENMKKMEEMAEERRRKWQRNNPDAGRYRPSGHMMRGPSGGPSYSH